MSFFETESFLSNYNIGVLGKGFVGSAVANGFSSNTGFEAKIRIFDKEPSRSTHSLKEVINNSEFVFISVPTPTDFKTGKIDISIVEDCFKDISLSLTNQKTIFLLRSTITPGTTDYIKEKYPNLRIVFNPEFLTQRSANLDFINQSRYIFGGDPVDTAPVIELYKKRFGESIRVIDTDYKSAELIKYMCNTFFAAKVGFLNEIYQICSKLELDWDSVLEGFISDGRIGHSHVQVPGPDGKFGFGGACFPKDVNALIHFADSLGISLNTLKGAWETNLLVRPEKDWEK